MSKRFSQGTLHLMRSPATNKMTSGERFRPGTSKNILNFYLRLESLVHLKTQWKAESVVSAEHSAMC